jgi:hypothetical protein
MQLEDTGKKIDHPTKGSKDLADCMAGVVTTLMGDRSFHRGLRSPRSTAGLRVGHASSRVRPSTGFEIPGMDFYSGFHEWLAAWAQSVLPPPDTGLASVDCLSPGDCSPASIEVAVSGLVDRTVGLSVLSQQFKKAKPPEARARRSGTGPDAT